MERKDFIEMFDKEYSIHDKYRATNSKKESYYKSRDNASKDDKPSRQYLDEKQSRMFEDYKLVYLSAFKSLPSILEIMYASDAELEQYRKSEIKKLEDIYGIRAASLHNDNNKLISLECDEMRLVSGCSLQPSDEEIQKGVSFKEQITELRKEMAKKQKEVDLIKKDIEVLKSLSIEELRQRALDAIPESEETIEMVKNAYAKRNNFQAFLMASYSPEDTRKLCELIQELTTYAKNSYPAFVQIDSKEKLPSDIARNIYDGATIGQIYRGVLDDPYTILQQAQKFYDKFNCQLVDFKSFICSGNIFDLRYLQKYEYYVEKDKGYVYPSPEHAEAFNYFIKNSGYIYSHQQLLDDNDYFDFCDLLQDYDDYKLRFFKKKEAKEAGDKLANKQIELFRKIRKHYADMLKSFNLLNIPRDINYYTNPTKIVTKEDCEKLINDQIAILEETKKQIAAFITLLESKIKDWNERFDEYNNGGNAIIKKIVELTGINSDDISFSDETVNLLLTDFSDDDLLTMIYDNAAAAWVTEIIDRAQERAFELSFEKELELRNMEPAELHRRNSEAEKTKVYIFGHKDKKEQQ